MHNINTYTGEVYPHNINTHTGVVCPHNINTHTGKVCPHNIITHTGRVCLHNGLPDQIQLSPMDMTEGYTEIDRQVVLAYLKAMSRHLLQGITPRGV